MAERRSINKRRISRMSHLFSLNSNSGISESDARFSLDGDKFWWKHLEDNTVGRRSTVFQIPNETTSHLDPSSTLESRTGEGRWWEALETSEVSSRKGNVQSEENDSDPEEKNEENISQDSDSEKLAVQRKKLPLRKVLRKSLNSNAFMKALNTSKQSTVSEPLLKRQRRDSNNSEANDNHRQSQSMRSHKNRESKGNHSQSMEDILKLKPKLVRKRRMSKSRNMFDDVLKEGAPNTPRKLSLRRSMPRITEREKINTDSESITMDRERVGAHGSSFGIDDDESNILLPKAQSTMLEATALNENSSDEGSESSATGKHVYKVKPKLLKRNEKLAESNKFREALMSDDPPRETEMQKSRREESTLVMRKSASTILNEPSNATSSSSLTGLQKKSQKLIPQDDASMSNTDVSSEISPADFIINSAYKPKSKFLNTWKRTTEQEHISETESRGGKESNSLRRSVMNRKSNVQEEITGQESYTSSYDMALRMSPQYSDEESNTIKKSAAPTEGSLSNQQNRTKRTSAVASRLENESNTVQSKNQVIESDVDSAPNMRRTSRALATDDDEIPQNKTRRTKGDSSLSQKNSTVNHTELALLEENDVNKKNASNRKGSHSRVGSKRLSTAASKAAFATSDETPTELFGATNDRNNAMSQSKSAKGQEDVSSGEEGDNEIFVHSSRSNIRNKSLSQRKSSSPVSRVSRSKTTTLPEEDVSQENDKDVRHNTRTSVRTRSSHRISDRPLSATLTSKTTTSVESDTDKEDDQVIGQSLQTDTRKKSLPHRIADSPTSKASEATPVTEDDIDKEHQQVPGRSARNSVANKSLSLHTLNSPTSRASKTKTPLVESDTDEDGTVAEKSARTSMYNRPSSDRKLKRSVSTVLRSGIASATEDDIHEQDDQVAGRSTRSMHTSVANKSVSRRTKSPISRASRSKTATLVESDTDEDNQADVHEQDEQVAGRSTRSIHTSVANKSVSRRTKSPISRASRSKTATLVESDTDEDNQADVHEQDDRVVRRSTRSTHTMASNKSVSRRIESPISRASKSKTTAVIESDTNEGERADVHEQHDQVVGRSTRSTNTGVANKSVSRHIDSPISRASKSKTTALIESDPDEDNQAEQTMRISTHNILPEYHNSTTTKTKVSIITDDDVNKEEPAVPEKSANTRGIDISHSAKKSSRSKSLAAKSTTFANDEPNDENRSGTKRTRSSALSKSVSTGISDNTAVNIEEGKSMTLEDKNDSEVGRSAKRLRTSMSASTRSEDVANRSTTRTFRGRASKVGVSYKEGNTEATDYNEDPNSKSVPSRKSTNRASNASKASRLNENDTNENDTATKEKTHQSTRMKNVSEVVPNERISNASKSRTNIIEESDSEVDIPNTSQTSFPIQLRSPLVPVTSTPIINTSKRSPVAPNSLESSDGETTSKPKENLGQQLTLEKRNATSVNITHQDEIDKDEIFNNTTGRKSSKNVSRGTSVTTAGNRTSERRSTTTLRHVHFSEDDKSEEEDTSAESRAPDTSPPAARDDIHNASSINISNMTKYSPLLSSTRRSIFSNVKRKRSSKLPSRPLNKRSTNQMAISGDNNQNKRTSEVSLFKTKSIPMGHNLSDGEHISQENETERDNEYRETDQEALERISESTALRDKSKVPSNQKTSQKRKSTLSVNKTNENQQDDHRFQRANNTIQEETSTVDPVAPQDGTENEPLTRNKPSIAHSELVWQQNRENQENSQMSNSQRNSTILNFFDKRKKKWETSKSKTTLGKSISRKDIGGKASKSMQRNMEEFVKRGTQKGFDINLLRTEHSSEEQPASQMLADASKREEIKREIAEFVKEQETVSTTKKDDLTTSVIAKPLKKQSKVVKSDMKKVTVKKPVHSAFLIDGKQYKPARLSRPKPWVTDRLYKYLEKRLEPKYHISTRVRSEKFIEQLAVVVSLILKKKKFDSYKDVLDNLMKEMARLGIVNNRSEFYHFCYDFLPYEFRVKVTPIALPGNHINIPYDPEKLYTPLLES